MMTARGNTEMLKIFKKFIEKAADKLIFATAFFII